MQCGEEEVRSHGRDFSASGKAAAREPSARRAGAFCCCIACGGVAAQALAKAESVPWDVAMGVVMGDERVAGAGGKKTFEKKATKST